MHTCIHMHTYNDKQLRLIDFVCSKESWTPGPRLALIIAISIMITIIMIIVSSSSSSSSSMCINTSSMCISCCISIRCVISTIIDIAWFDICMIMLGISIAIIVIISIVLSLLSLLLSRLDSARLPRRGAARERPIV